jgi:subtilisin family serine protease
LAPFSSAGADLLGPGVNLPVAAPEPSIRGSLEALLGRIVHPRTPWTRPAEASGTSYAAPWVASVAALMIAADRTIDPERIEALLRRSAREVPTTPTGAVDVVRAVRDARQRAPESARGERAGDEPERAGGERPR